MCPLSLSRDTSPPTNQRVYIPVNSVARRVRQKESGFGFLKLALRFCAVWMGLGCSHKPLGPNLTNCLGLGLGSWPVRLTRRPHRQGLKAGPPYPEPCNTHSRSQWDSSMWRGRIGDVFLHLEKTSGIATPSRPPRGLGQTSCAHQEAWGGSTLTGGEIRMKVPSLPPPDSAKLPLLLVGESLHLCHMHCWEFFCWVGGPEGEPRSCVWNPGFPRSRVRCVWLEEECPP